MRLKIYSELALCLLFLQQVVFVKGYYKIFIEQLKGKCDDNPIINLTEIQLFLGSTQLKLSNSSFSFGEESSGYPAWKCNDGNTKCGAPFDNNLNICKSGNDNPYSQNLTINYIYQPFDKIVVYNAYGYNDRTPTPADVSLRILRASLTVTNSLTPVSTPTPAPTSQPATQYFVSDDAIFTFTVPSWIMSPLSPTRLPTRAPSATNAPIGPTIRPTTSWPTMKPTTRFPTFSPSGPSRFPTRIPTTREPSFSTVPTYPSPGVGTNKYDPLHSQQPKVPDFEPTKEGKKSENNNDKKYEPVDKNKDLPHHEVVKPKVATAKAKVALRKSIPAVSDKDAAASKEQEESDSSSSVVSNDDLNPDVVASRLLQRPQETTKHKHLRKHTHREATAEETQDSAAETASVDLISSV